MPRNQFFLFILLALDDFIVNLNKIFKSGVFKHTWGGGGEYKDKSEEAKAHLTQAT